MKLPRVKHDKANHFIYGFAIYILSNMFVNEWYSLLFVCLIAFLTEFWDEWKYKAFDLWDAIWTIIPAIILLIKNYI